eukprot:COSAG02_NODE_4108_length_5768_cov_66.257717_3_plen_191_part_00
MKPALVVAELVRGHAFVCAECESPAVGGSAFERTLSYRGAAHRTICSVVLCSPTAGYRRTWYSYPASSCPARPTGATQRRAPTMRPPVAVPRHTSPLPPPPPPPPSASHSQLYGVCAHTTTTAWVRGTTHAAASAAGRSQPLTSKMKIHPIQDDSCRMRIKRRISFIFKLPAPCGLHWKIVPFLHRVRPY